MQVRGHTSFPRPVLLALLNPEPKIVRRVPPARLPMSGVTLQISGAADAHIRRSRWMLLQSTHVPACETEISVHSSATCAVRAVVPPTIVGCSVQQVSVDTARESQRGE